jgi:hypothetical protein
MEGLPRGLPAIGDLAFSTVNTVGRPGGLERIERAG